MEPTPDSLQAPASYGLGSGRDAAAKLPWTRVVEWLRASRNYWVCTSRDDGRPHAKPVWGLWLEEMLAFSTHPDSVTGRNLRRDPRVVIHLESGDEVVILEGEARPLAQELFDRYADAYDAKYGFRPHRSTDAPPWALFPDKAMSWTESDFPTTAARWTFR